MNLTELEQMYLGEFKIKHDMSDGGDIMII